MSRLVLSSEYGVLVWSECVLVRAQEVVVRRVVSMFECVEVCGGCVGKNVGKVLQTWLLVEVLKVFLTSLQLTIFHVLFFHE